MGLSQYIYDVSTMYRAAGSDDSVSSQTEVGVSGSVALLDVKLVDFSVHPPSNLLATTLKDDSIDNQTPRISSVPPPQVSGHLQIVAP